MIMGQNDWTRIKVLPLISLRYGLISSQSFSSFALVSRNCNKCFLLNFLVGSLVHLYLHLSEGGMWVSCNENKNICVSTGALNLQITKKIYLSAMLPSPRVWLSYIIFTSPGQSDNLFFFTLLNI